MSKIEEDLRSYRYGQALYSNGTFKYIQVHLAIPVKRCSACSSSKYLQIRLFAGKLKKIYIY